MQTSSFFYYVITPDMFDSLRHDNLWPEVTNYR